MRITGLKVVLMVLIISVFFMLSATAQDKTSEARQQVPDLVRIQPYSAHRVSSNDATGGNFDKLEIQPGETVTVAQIDGPAMINHIWITIKPEVGGDDYLSTVILRFYWDGSDKPAIEAPIGMLFGLGHNEVADVNNAAMTVFANHQGGYKSPPGLAAFNLYLPMPFRKKAVITAENTNPDIKIRCFYHHIDYRAYKQLPDDVCYLHAQLRREKTTAGELPDDMNPTYENNYTILDVAGQGHYVGCLMNVEAHQNEKGKWYEGDEIIRVDGAPLSGAILGTGSEDYFNLAWGVRRSVQGPYAGVGYLAWNPGEREGGSAGRFSLYRWHLPDPIPFEKSISVTIEHGHNNDAENQYSSVAYYYLMPQK